MLHKINIFISDAGMPWLFAKYAVCSDIGSTRRLDGYSCIKPCPGSIFDVRPVTKSLIFEKIVDDVDIACILGMLVGAFVRFWYVDRVFAYT